VAPEIAAARELIRSGELLAAVAPHLGS
jgi:hypothetical protein